MLKYEVEELTEDLIVEMIPRQKEYWDEVASPFHQFPPDVDWNLYTFAQKTNRLRLLCGRNQNRELKAVAFIVINNHPHYACIAASLPLLYLAPECRNGREGLRLIEKCEDVAQDYGAQLIMTHGGIHNRVAEIFEFMQYEDFGRYFVKVLADGPNGVKPIFKEGR